MAKARCSPVLCMLLVLTLVLIQHVAECSSSGAYLELLHRKFLMEKKLEKGFKMINGGSTEFVRNAKKNEMSTEDWELRGVPAGPDPLHHNGQDPNKPRTP